MPAPDLTLDTSKLTPLEAAQQISDLWKPPHDDEYREL
jgi:chloramphenicol 3-O-phosphotransferase